MQTHALACWESDGDFRATIESLPEIQSQVSAEQLAQAFSYERQLGNVDAIFARVFGQS